jgi:hypothetical protein
MKVNNLVAKHAGKFNRASIQPDKKNTFTRKLKHKNRGI